MTRKSRPSTEMRPSSSRIAPPVRFAVRYLAIAGALFSLYAFPYESFGISESWFQAYLAGYAQLVGAVLGLFEPVITVRDATLVGRTSLQIVKSCDAMEAKLLLSSAILAFPAPLGRRLLAVLGGLIMLTALNVLRIVTLYYVLLVSQHVFEFVHIELWPLLMVLATAALFFGSVRFMRPSGGGGTEPTLTHAAS